MKGPGEVEGVLAGVRILDFSRVLAGPYATRVFADLGAEVIKVQSRRVATGAESEESGYFRMWNRNKRSITLDMDRPGARELVLRLTAICDIVVENFSPRVMSNWGLGFADLIEARPDLIMLSMSCMGQTGPWRNHVGFGPTVQALSGHVYLSSYDRDHPVGLGYSYADMVSGLYGVFALLAALEHRDRTGLGQHIDLSEYEAICTVLGEAYLEAGAMGDALPHGNGAAHLPAAPHGCYPCRGANRWCVIAAFDEPQWQGLCDVLGRGEWTREERFGSLPLRKEHSDALDRLLGEATLEHEAEPLVEALQKAGVPSGVVQNAHDLAHDPHLWSRGFFEDLEYRSARVLTDSLPLRPPGWVKRPWKPAPALGEDNRYVLLQLLGIGEAEFDELVCKGVIA